MKRPLLFFLCVLLLMSALALSVLAHPGRTDSNGGHWDHSTGEYHYHGTPDSNGSGSSSSGSTTNRDWGNSSTSSAGSASSGGSDAGEIIGTIIACIVLGPSFLFMLWGIVISPIVDKIKDRFQKPTAEETPVKPPEDEIVSSAPEKKPPASKPCSTPTVPPPAPSTPQIRGAENDLIISPRSASTTPRPKPTPRASQPIPQAAPTTAPTPRPLPFANGIIAEHPLILGADPDYLTEAQVLAYALSIETPRGKRAVTEQFLLDNIHIDEGGKPFRVTCSTTSLNSYQRYRTTLVSCTCKDHQTRHLPCKHMIALAIKLNAITVDTEALQNRQERS